MVKAKADNEMTFTSDQRIARQEVAADTLSHKACVEDGFSTASDGRKFIAGLLAVMSERGYPERDVFAVHLPTGQVRRVTDSRASNAIFMAPAICPDGRNMAVIRAAPIDALVGDLVLLGPTNEVSACIARAIGMTAVPRWSSDRSFLVFSDRAQP